MGDTRIDQSFREGKYEAAVLHLEEGIKKQGENGRDLLLYLLDLGLTLHTAGKFEESNKVFLKADKVAEIKDYTSLVQEGATLITSENLKDYKGEDFENVLISTYLAMNYAMLGDTENALVEAKRVNRKLYLMVSEGQRKYKQNAFARYLSAILYESEGNYNDAYVDYKKTQELEPDYPGLGQDLWRLAWFLHMRDEMEKWDGQYHLTQADHESAKELGASKKRKGEIIILYENGISPIKRAHPNWYSLPKFFPRANPVSIAKVSVNGNEVGETHVLDNVEATAISNLDEKWGGLLAKKIAGVVVKEVLADQVEKKTNSAFLGALARIAMYASDQADLRSWNLLPKDLQLARIRVEPGTYTVKVHPQGVQPLPEKTIQVGAGKKVFVGFRYIPW